MPGGGLRVVLSFYNKTLVFPSQFALLFPLKKIVVYEDGDFHPAAAVCILTRHFQLEDCDISAIPGHCILRYIFIAVKKGLVQAGLSRKAKCFQHESTRQETTYFHL